MTASEALKEMLRDRTLPVLVMANFVNILLAMELDFGFATQVWIYLCQSLIIGFFNFRRMLLMRPSEDTVARWDRENAWSYSDMKMQGITPGWMLPDTVAEYVRQQHWTPGAPKVFAGIFVVHYGLFHLFYAFALLPRGFSMVPGAGLAGADLPGVAAGTLVFLVYHAWSFRAQRKEMEKPFRSDCALMKAMFLPYARVLPIHLTAVFYAGSSFTAFLVLKALADVAAHAVELAWRKRVTSEE